MIKATEHLTVVWSRNLAGIRNHLQHTRTNQTRGLVLDLSIFKLFSFEFGVYNPLITSFIYIQMVMVCAAVTDN